MFLTPFNLNSAHLSSTLHSPLPLVSLSGLMLSLFGGGGGGAPAESHAIVVQRQGRVGGRTIGQTEGEIQLTL